MESMQVQRIIVTDNKNPSSRSQFDDFLYIPCAAQVGRLEYAFDADSFRP